MIFITSKDLFDKYAPSFNFELNEAELVAKAIAVGFIDPITNSASNEFFNIDILYMINRNYKGDDLPTIPVI